MAGCLSHGGIVSKRQKPILKLFQPSGSPVTLFFYPWRRYPNPRVTPSAGAINTRDGKNWRFSTEITVYLGNSAR